MGRAEKFLTMPRNNQITTLGTFDEQTLDTYPNAILSMCVKATVGHGGSCYHPYNTSERPDKNEDFYYNTHMCIELEDRCSKDLYSDAAKESKGKCLRMEGGTCG